MISDDEKAKLKFELANANAQSIGRAQGLYVTALLTYIGLVWTIFFVGSSEVSFHLPLLDVKVNGVWSITPPVLLILTLAYIGAVTAATPAVAQRHKAEKELFGSKEHSFFDLDSYKNIIDYLAVLQVLPNTRTRKPKDDDGSEPFWHRLHHLILPTLFLGSAFTSYWAVHELSGIGPSYRAVLFVDWGCFALQIAYSVRPCWRFIGRFIGAKCTSNVFN